MDSQAAPEIAELIGRSNRLGADPRNTNYAGGNTSAKGTVTDPVTGQPAELRADMGLDPDPIAAYHRSGYQDTIVAERVGGTQASWAS